MKLLSRTLFFLPWRAVLSEEVIKEIMGFIKE